MRLERLVIETAGQTLTLELHERLTVIAGMGPIERRSLLGELIGALGGRRSGVHVEIEERSGRRLAVFRPTIGVHRVIDVDRAADVSAEFTDGEGACNLLAPLGLTTSAARQVMSIDADDLTTDSRRGEAVQALAMADQRRLWSAAEALAQAEGELTTEAEALGSAPEDAAVIDEVERRHAQVERAAEALESTRKRTFWIAGVAAVVTIPGVVATGPVALLLLAVAVTALLASLIARARLARAGRAEEAALAEAGASTYLGFQLHRVNGLLGDDATRRSLMEKAQARRSALATWQQLAGDIPVEWAQANAEEITATARLRRDVDVLGSLSTTAPDVDDDTANDLAHVLVSRLAEARSIAAEGVPLLLDDPFRDMDPSVKPLLLELLGRSAGQPQIVFLTDDEDVASWARLESLTGDVALVEPSPEAVEHRVHDTTSAG